MTPPNLLYRDQDLLYRTIREACTEDVKEIVVDTAFAMQRSSKYFAKLAYEQKCSSNSIQRNRTFIDCN